MHKDAQRILLFLPRYHCLTEQQMRRLLGRKSETSFNPLLRQLVSDGYLVGARQNRVSRYAYFLTPTKGYEWVAMEGRPSTIRRTPAKIKEFINSDLAHTILVNDVVISLELFCQQDPSFVIASVIHERDFKSNPLPLPNDNFLAPDAWIELHQRIGTKRGRFWFALEVQGESNWTSNTIRQKVRKYITLEGQGSYRDMLSLPEQAVFWVLFVASGHTARARVIKTAIEKELTAQGKHEDFAGMFCIAPVQNTVFGDPVWYQPFSDEEKPLWEWL